MTYIYLIRHGHKVSEAGDPALTELGIKQAIQTGEYLKKFPITRVIASPYKRTVQTALHISQALGLKHQLSENLVERMNWVGGEVSRDDFINEWIKSSHNREYVPLYGDSSFQTGQKVAKVIENFQNQGKESHAVLVSHGGAIVDYLRNTFGDEKVRDLLWQYEEGPDYRMYNCAINKVVLDEQPTLELLNYVDHLGEKSE